MKKNIITKITFFIALNMMLTCYAANVNADDKYTLSLGVKLLSSNWKGKNTNSGTDFEQSEGGQSGWNFGLQKGRFYTGLSLQGGKYNFSGDGPDQVSLNNTVSVKNVEADRSELDLLAGYYFWDNISLFIDLKSIENKYNKNNYTQNFTGIGLGIAGAWPLNDDWSLYGSFGFVTKGDVEANGTKVGTAKSTAFEFGSVYRIAELHRLNFGLKTQGQEFSFDNATSQTHTINGLFIGYSYLIRF